MAVFGKGFSFGKPMGDGKGASGPGDIRIQLIGQLGNAIGNQRSATHLLMREFGLVSLLAVLDFVMHTTTASAAADAVVDPVAAPAVTFPEHSELGSIASYFLAGGPDWTPETAFEPDSTPETLQAADQVQVDNLRIVADDVSDAVQAVISNVSPVASESVAETSADKIAVAAVDGIVLHGTDHGDLLIGTAGADILYGGAGNDTLIGGDGNDRLDGGKGADLMIGGRGNDTYVVDNVADTIVEAKIGGNDTVETTLRHFELQEHVENLVYTGHESFTGIGNDEGNYIRGGDRMPAVEPAVTSHVVPATIETFTATPDASDPAASASADTAPTQIETAAAPASLESSGMPSTEAPTDTPEQFAAPLAELLGGPQDVLVFLPETGSAAAPKAPQSAPAANDDPVLTTVSGTRQNDILNGTYHGGDDFLDGGKGNDTLDGGSGDDVLTGGSGNDTFIFRRGFGNDTITDFHRGSGDRDVIWFQSDVFANYDDLDAHMVEVGDHVVITTSDHDQLTVQNVNKMMLSSHDSFMFF